MCIRDSHNVNDETGTRHIKRKVLVFRTVVIRTFTAAQLVGSCRSGDQAVGLLPSRRSSNGAEKVKVNAREENTSKLKLTTETTSIFKR